MGRFRDVGDDVEGLVTVNNAPEKHSLRRFCQKKVAQWLKTKRSSLNEKAAFSVLMENDPVNKRVICVTEIRLGPSKWRGCDLATDLQNAFMRSMKRLQTYGGAD